MHLVFNLYKNGLFNRPGVFTVIPTQVDNLIFTYQNGCARNQLAVAKDNSVSTIGFKDRANTTNEYQDGTDVNLKSDQNKNQIIIYNDLNKVICGMWESKCSGLT